MKRMVCLLTSLALLSVAFLAWGETPSLGVSAGRAGVESVYSDNYLGVAVQGEVLPVSATFASGIGAEVAPLSYRYDSQTGYLGVSLVNLTGFYRAVKFDETSFLGPFATVNWVDFQSYVPTIRAGVRFSWIEPWELKGVTVKPILGAVPLLHYVDAELGFLWQERPAVYLAFSTDAAIVGALAVAMLYSKADEDAKKINPDYSRDLPAKDTTEPPLILENKDPTKAP
jgi:hypothetical protein